MNNVHLIIYHYLYDYYEILYLAFVFVVMKIYKDVIVLMIDSAEQVWKMMQMLKMDLTMSPSYEQLLVELSILEVTYYWTAYLKYKLLIRYVLIYL